VGVEPKTIRQYAGFTLIELLLVIAIIAIVAAIAVPSLMRARLATNESSAIASLRTISSAQAAFAATCGKGGFAQSLADLGRVPAGTHTAFIPADLATGRKTGYQFELTGNGTVTLAADTCNGATQDAVSSFLATGNPLVDGATGVRAFGVDQTSTLRWTGAAAGITNAASYQAAAVLP
jgi:type IV pilus assembly protein PilA